MEKTYGINTSKKEVDLLNPMQKQVYRLLFDACRTVEIEQATTINELLRRPWHEAPKTKAEIEVERKENAELLKMHPDISEIPINPNKVVGAQPNKELTAMGYVETTGRFCPNTDGFACNWFFNGGNDKLVLIEALSKDIITATVEAMQNTDSLTDDNLKYWLLTNYSNENCSTFSSFDAFVEIYGDQWQELLKDSFVSFFHRFFLYLSQVWKNDTTLPPKPFAGLLRELDDTKLENLFNLLKEFINIGQTTQKSIDYIFGGKEKPQDFKQIEWKANKQFLIDLLTGLQKEVKHNKINTNTRELSNEIKRQSKLYFLDSKTKQSFELPKNNNRLKNRAEYTRITKFLATL